MSDLGIVQTPSPNSDERGEAPLDMLVLHYTGMADAAAALRRLTDPDPRLGAYRADLPPAHRAPHQEDAHPLGRVSAHYVVEGDGRIHQLVAEERRAWHAGVASWAGAADINARSIGIEIVNGGHDYPDANGAPSPYPQAQIAAVRALTADILARRSIAPWRVLGHSDVAPERKHDPGEHFPWAVLDAAGLAIGPPPLEPTPAIRVVARPGAAGPPVMRLQQRLAAWGYGVAPSGGFDERTAAVITAFQRHFRPDADRFGVWTSADEAAFEAVFWRARALAGAARRADRPYAVEPPHDPFPSV